MENKDTGDLSRLIAGLAVGKDSPVGNSKISNGGMAGSWGSYRGDGGQNVADSYVRPQYESRVYNTNEHI